MNDRDNQEATFLINREVASLFSPIRLKINHFPISELNLIRSNSIVFADADKLKFPLQLRKWEQGDYFHPFGMKGKKKKVSDFFSDEKVNLFEKENTWLLTSDNKIVAIMGYRSDERFKITEKTKNVTRIEIVKD